jgi:hypothetical protein
VPPARSSALAAAGPEPSVLLRLEVAGGRIERAALLPRGLPDLAPALLGQPVAEAAARLARLLAACPWAHSVALCEAAEAAVAAPASPARRAARGLLLLAERARALSLRRAVAWPALVGEPVRAALAKAILAAADGLARAVGLAEPRAALVAERARLLAAHDALEAALAPLARDPLAERLAAEAAGLGGSLGRVVAHSLAERLAADRRLLGRVRGLVPGPAPEPAPAPLLGSGRGSAALRTDRGRLVWGVELRQGRLASVAWVTPTDRAIRGDHPVLQALGRARSGTSPARLAALAMAAVDPCWPWRLELVPAASGRRPSAGAGASLEAAHA